MLPLQITTKRQCYWNYRNVNNNFTGQLRLFDVTKWSWFLTWHKKSTHSAETRMTNTWHTSKMSKSQSTRNVHFGTMNSLSTDTSMFNTILLYCLPQHFYYVNKIYWEKTSFYYSHLAWPLQWWGGKCDLFVIKLNKIHLINKIFTENLLYKLRLV